MYINFGDKDFFEHGRLVDTEHSDTEIKVLYCEPYPDEEDLCLFADCAVDLEDDQFDWTAIKKWAGLSEGENADARNAWLAIAAIDYYGVENFSSHYDGYQFSKKEICERLKYYLIANDNLKVVW